MQKLTLTESEAHGARFFALWDFLTQFASLHLLSQSPQPIVRGALRQTPLAEFLVQAYDSALDGTLLLQTPEREKSTILFVRGAPAKARPAKDLVSLGDVAVDLGLIPRSLATSTLKRASAAGLEHMKVLRDEGHIDDTGQFIALREHLFRSVLALCELPDTTGYGFYQANYLANWGPPGEWRVKPLPMMWRAVADHLPAARRAAWLEKLGAIPLRLRPEAPVSRYALSKTELGILDMLRAMPVPLERLSESGVGDPESVRKVACALLLTRQIEVGSKRAPVGLNEPGETPNSVAPPETRAARRTITAPRAPSIPAGMEESISPPPLSHPAGSVRSPAARPSPRSQAPGAVSTHPRASSMAPRSSGTDTSAAFRAEVEDYKNSPRKTHYELLGVARDADTSVIRSAFFQLARRWHPDRLPESFADLRPTVTKAFAAMGEAHAVLSDDKKRAEYNRLLQEVPEDEQEQVAAILNAAGAFQRAEVFMKKKDFTQALALAREAYEADPTQADYAALYAWLQGTQRSENFGELIALLDKALSENGDNVRALWYRSQLLKKVGKYPTRGEGLQEDHSAQAESCRGEA